MGYKRVIEERPEPKKQLTTEAKALNEKALEFIKQQQYETAIPLLEQANQLDPYDIEIMNNFGFVLSKSERLGQAEFVLNLVLQNKPDRAIAWANYADVLATNGKQELAIGAYANALRFSNNRSHTRSFLNKQLEIETNKNILSAIPKALEKSAQIAEWSECALPINLGDTREKVQQVFKTTAQADAADSYTKGASSMDLSNIGMNIIFFVDGKVDTIRLTAPFCGSINGISLGDNLATLKLKMGEPKDPPSNWGRRTYHYGTKQFGLVGFTVDNYNVIESMELHFARTAYNQMSH
jgi:tetratricopeptide (TPR) repeat protein